MNQCERCGKDHEVHATVLLQDGSEIIVGTGCMREEHSSLTKKAKNMATRAKRLKSYRVELEWLERKINQYRAAWAKVIRLRVPTFKGPVEEPLRSGLDIRYRWELDGLQAWSFCVSDRHERRAVLVEKWRHREMERQGIGFKKESLMRRINELKAKIKKLV